MRGVLYLKGSRCTFSYVWDDYMYDHLVFDDEISGQIFKTGLDNMQRGEEPEGLQFRMEKPVRKSKLSKYLYLPIDFYTNGKDNE